MAPQPRYFGVVILLMLGAWFLTGFTPLQAAQIIYLKNGSTLTGRILESESTEDYYTIDIFTGKTTIRRDSVLRIIEGQDYVLARAQGDAFRQQRRWIPAALHYQQAILNTDDKRIQQDCRGEIEKIALEIIKELRLGNPNDLPLEQCRYVAGLTENHSLVDQMNRVINEVLQDSLRQWLAEGKTALSLKRYDEALERFNRVIGSATDYAVYMQDARNEKAKVFIEKARPFFQSQVPTERLEAEQYLLQALSIQPQNDRANYMLGTVYFRMGRPRLELDYFLKVRDSNELSESERLFVRRRINRILARMEQLEAEVERQEMPPPLPPDTSLTASLAQRLRNFWSNLVFSISSGGTGWFRELGELLLYILVPAALVYLIFWYLPYRMVRWHTVNQARLKKDYVRLAKLWGIFGMLYYFGSILLTKRPKVSCPNCKKPLESPILFEDWNFSHCPYCTKAIKAPYSIKDYVQTLAKSIVADRAAQDGKRSSASVAGRESTLKLIRAVITAAARERASDIHIEAEDPGELLFRFRIDGVLHDSIRVPLSLHSLIITAIKNLAELDIAERRVPQDGHFSMMVETHELSIRVATTPTRTGEKAVLRLLTPRESILQPTELGFSPESLMKFEKAILSPHGIILSTGPTGSGKTTTLYSALAILSNGQKNIVTIEDPIEYEIPGVNQIQVNTKAGLNFGNALRSILRQDPDVIMVGEIRDRETAEIAANAALTGHLVFSTLHTIDTSTALSRLIDLGVEHKQVASAVVAIIAQRLVRKICPNCKKAYKPREEELKKLGTRSSDTDENTRFYYGIGCDECQNSGYIGRTGLFEILHIQSGKGHVQKALEAGAATLTLREAARRDGMRSLRDEGILKIMQGITTTAEVLRVTQEEMRFVADVAGSTDYISPIE